MKISITDDSVTFSLSPDFGLKKETVSVRGVDMPIATCESILENSAKICKSLVEQSDDEVLKSFRISTVGNDEQSRNLTKESEVYVQKYLNGALFKSAIFSAFDILKRILKDGEIVTLNLSNTNDYRLVQGLLIQINSYRDNARETYINESSRKVNAVLESFQDVMLETSDKDEFLKMIGEVREECDNVAKEFAKVFYSQVDSQLSDVLEPLYFISDLPDPSRKLKAFSDKYKDVDFKIEIDKTQYTEFMTSFKNAKAEKLKELST